MFFLDACVVNTPLSTGHVKRDCINTEAKNQAQTNSKVGAVVDSSVSISNETTSPESSTACTITRSVDSVIARMSAASQPAMKSLTKPSKQKKRSISIKGRQDDK